MKYTYLILILLLTTIQISYSQNSEKPNYKIQAGFTAGTIMGFGPSIKINKDKNAIQFTVLPIFGEDFKGYNSSVGFIRKLIYSKNVDFSFVSSIMLFGTTENDSKQRMASLNVGSQIEYKITNYLFFEARAGFGYYYGSKSNYNSPTKSGYYILPTFGLGLMYNFLLE